MFKNYRNIILLIAAAILFTLFSTILSFYTDWLFFIETGYSSVFTTTLTAKVSSALLFGLLLFVIMIINFFFANGAKISMTSVFANGKEIHLIKREDLAVMLKPLGILISLALAFFVARWGALQWDDLLLFRNMVSVGITDPIFGMDIGFYMFSLPFLEILKGFAGFAIVASLLLSAAVYYIRGGILLTDRGANVDPLVKKHLAVLIGLFSLVIAGGFYLECFQLLLSGNGSFHGAGYTDINARLLTLRLLTVITPVTGAVLSYGIWKNSWRLTFVPPILLVAIYMIGVRVYPGILQKFKVAPNELALEMPYIEHNIKFTRLGYDLDKIETIPFDVDSKLSATDISNNDATIKNIRLWDHAPLLKTYSQLQQIRTYYKFFDVDNDRYMVNGRYSQVMLSPRELSYSDLPSKNWINERLIFTHGNGLTMGPVSRISKEGLPEFFIKDIPPVSLANIKVTRPEIYFGELSNEYVIVKTKVPEFSYPTATENINTTYTGKGGVVIDSALKKAVFAARFKTEKILLSSDITSESRIIYNQ